MRSTKATFVMLAVALVVLGTAAVGPVSAHESETIDGYTLTFGGAEEPVITGERMWLQLRITDEDGEPVSDLAESMHWRVEKPGEVDPVALDVSEKHGAPGVYQTAVLFTEPGEYVVHVETMIGETEIHTHFEKEVADRSALEYPEGQAEDAAAAPGFGLDFGGGIALGAIAVVLAFLIGRRFTSVTFDSSRPEPAE